MGWVTSTKTTSRPHASFCSVPKTRSRGGPAVYHKADRNARRYRQSRYNLGHTDTSLILRMTGIGVLALSSGVNMMLHVALRSKAYVSTPFTDACSLVMLAGLAIFVIGMFIPAPRRR